MRTCQRHGARPRVAEEVGPPAWGLGEVLTTPHRKKQFFNVTQGFRIGGLL